jgi:hypothetical protein
MEEKKIKPDYYSHGCSLECIDAMVLAYGAQTAYCFCLGSMFKYLWRYEQKNGIEDVLKAQTYLEMIRKLDEVYIICVDDDVLDAFDKEIEYLLKKEETK